ncbi:hypothetical protein PUN28_008103 [Cardiocondyla obscurior]|uniref:Transmembrane protein n=1 Tax=Cardiocondyla obscurior TaxID=286306 RepID=A0AAW2FYP3_9HYME
MKFIGKYRSGGEPDEGEKKKRKRRTRNEINKNREETRDLKENTIIDLMKPRIQFRLTCFAISYFNAFFFIFFFFFLNYNVSRNILRFCLYVRTLCLRSNERKFNR